MFKILVYVCIFAHITQLQNFEINSIFFLCSINDISLFATIYLSYFVFAGKKTVNFHSNKYFCFKFNPSIIYIKNTFLFYFIK